MRIGIMGGSFNPVHRGHLHAARFCAQKLVLEEVWFIPAYVPPHKPESLFISSYHRYAMIELAIQKNFAYKALPIEVETTHVCFTIDTIKNIIAPENKQADKTSLNSSNQFFFIMGSDTLLEFQTWKNYNELLDIIYFAVLERKNNDFSMFADLPACITSRFTALLNPSFCSAKNIILLPGKMLPVSSSRIRELISEGKNFERLVPSSVANYIKKYKLYKT